MLATTSTSFFVPTAFASTALLAPPPTLQDLSDSIALEHHIATSTLRNMVFSESGWDPQAVGDDGCSLGLVQINICAHPDVNSEDASEPAFALNYAAQAVASGTEEDDWTSCNCYSLVWTKIKNLPHMSAIVPNAEPHAGDVAIFFYKDRQTGKMVKHIAYTLKVAAGKVTITEANKTHCLIDTRTIPISDPNLAGFWSNGGV